MRQAIASLAPYFGTALRGTSSIVTRDVAHDPLLHSIAANVRRLRIRHGWSQEHLAELANVGLRAVQRLESGAVDPSATTLRDFAAAFGVPVGALFRAAVLPPRNGAGRPPKRKRSKL